MEERRAREMKIEHQVRELLESMIPRTESDSPNVVLRGIFHELRDLREKLSPLDSEAKKAIEYHVDNLEETARTLAGTWPFVVDSEELIELEKELDWRLSS